MGAILLFDDRWCALLGNASLPLHHSVLFMFSHQLSLISLTQNELSTRIHQGRISRIENAGRPESQRWTDVCPRSKSPAHLASPFVHAHRTPKPSNIPCVIIDFFHLIILVTRTKHLHALYLPRPPNLIASVPPTAYSLGLNYISLMRSALLARNHWWMISSAIPGVH